MESPENSKLNAEHMSLLASLQGDNLGVEFPKQKRCMYAFTPFIHIFKIRAMKRTEVN